MRKLLVAATGLVVVVAGCGGGDHAVRTLSRTSFLAAANQVCATAPTHGSRLARLRALHPPANTAELYSHWLTAERDARAAAVAVADPAKSFPIDPEVALAIAEGKIAGYADRLGAVTCAKRTTGTMPP